MSRLEILRGLKDRDRDENFLTCAELDLICYLIEELEEDNSSYGPREKNMKKPKFIQEHEELDYKKRLKEFMQNINPKEAEEALDKLRQKYMAKRGE